MYLGSQKSLLELSSSPSRWQMNCCSNWQNVMCAFFPNNKKTPTFFFCQREMLQHQKLYVSHILGHRRSLWEQTCAQFAGKWTISDFFGLSMAQPLVWWRMCHSPRLLLQHEYAMSHVSSFERRVDSSGRLLVIQRVRSFRAAYPVGAPQTP